MPKTKTQIKNSNVRKKISAARVKTPTRSIDVKAPRLVTVGGTETTNTAKPMFQWMEMNMTPNKDFEKMTKDMGAFGQEQMDAFVKSGTIFTKGMEGVMKACMEMAQSSSEKAQAAAKAMMTCKTVNEFAEAQSKFAQSSFDDFMNTSTKMSEMTVKLANECMAPMNDQFGKAMKKASATKAA